MSELRLIRVSESHIAAARHLLTLIAQTPDAASPPAERSSDRTSLVKRARMAFGLRRRRDRIFAKSFYGEPAFDILLALYVVESENVSLSLKKLAELASLPHATAVRWIDLLAADGFIAREPHPTDRRKSAIKLLPKGQAALDELFGDEAESGLAWA